VKNLCEFRGLDLLEMFASLFKLFESLYYGFSHSAMGLFRSADDRKLLTRSDAFVTILIIESNTEQPRSWFARLFLFTHAVTVVGFISLSSGNSVSTAWQ